MERPDEDALLNDWANSLKVPEKPKALQEWSRFEPGLVKAVQIPELPLAEPVYSVDGQKRLGRRKIQNEKGMVAD